MNDKKDLSKITIDLPKGVRVLEVIFLNTEPDQNKDIILDKELWNSFINKLDSLEDSLITAIFKQASFLIFISETSKVYIEFPKDFVMFKNILLESKKQWLPLLREIFKESVNLIATYQEDE